MKGQRLSKGSETAYGGDNLSGCATSGQSKRCHSCSAASLLRKKRLAPYKAPDDLSFAMIIAQQPLDVLARIASKDSEQRSLHELRHSPRKQNGRSR